LDKGFPNIINYTWKKSNATINGQSDLIRKIKINDSLFTPIVRFTKKGNTATYQLKINEIAVVINIEISVIKNIVALKFTSIIENPAFKIHTIAFPNHNLISINSKEKDASFSGSKMFTAIAGSGDEFKKITKKSQLDSTPTGYLYTILNNKNLAAALWSNSVQEKSDHKRILKQTTEHNNFKQTAIWSGSWIYRANRMSSIDALPELKIIITDDINFDSKVNWQDGAIAYREILNIPKGSERIPEMVVQRIPMNFASQATNPFTKSLDETKRIYLNTDGLGQYVILKGYGSEGHDSKHPDYGDIGKRQGGAEEMNIICDAAPKYNTSIGVHINGTESYPEALAFNEHLIDKTKEGWNWLDQSYYMDKRYDALTNNRFRRLKSLKDQVPNLDFIYVDVWYAKGSWDSRKMAKEINSLDLFMTTEFPQDHEYDAIWNHWAVDYKYGGKDIKGYNSKIVRFIRNHQKDTWIAKHPVLGGTEMVDFEGWQGRTNYDSCIQKTFDTNLTTKYLQHFPILKWDKNNIHFTNNVNAKIVSGKRIITKDNHIIFNNGSYLLPWNPKIENKLYHWSTTNNTSSWTVPNSWKNHSHIQLYKLTDTGKQFIKTIQITDQLINLTVSANSPYVIYPTKQEDTTAIFWGEGTPIKDPGFNNGNLKFWEVSDKSVFVSRNNKGQYELQFNANNKETSVSQSIKSLTKGTYVASVHVASNNRKAILSVTQNGQEKSNYCKNSLTTNYIAADSKHDSRMQRMFVYFNISNDYDLVKLSLKSEKGEATVLFDDVRIQKITSQPKDKKLYFQENFEHVPSGIYPFVKGAGGGANDPRIHLAEKNAPYTQKGWNNKKTDDVLQGNWSLKIHEDADGRMIQTIPQTLRFNPNKKYTIKFLYQSEKAAYNFILSAGNNVITSTKINTQLNTQEFSCTFTADKSGESWFGFEKDEKETSDLIIDELKIIEH